ncbi:MAG: hypothetical protein M3Z66_05875 [Chloroflexota bacterium]|nr:hypothetical protein [Chloroflexota bacterium]
MAPYRSLAALGIAVALWLVPARAEPAVVPQAPRGHAARIVAHGLRVTLRVPEASYARNILTRGFVTVQNVSHAAVSLERAGGRPCGDINPWIEAANSAGRVVYPPALRVEFPSPCKQLTGLRFAPGQQHTWRVDLIVRGRYLRTAVRLASSRTTIRTPALAVELIPAAAPQVTIGSSLQGPYATVTPPGLVHGAMLYQSSCFTGGTGVTDTVNVLTWTPSRGTRIYAGCLSPSEWHAVAGWLGQPVATIDEVHSTE